MLPVKSFDIKNSPKKERQQRVLYALVEQYIKTGKAIGSHTLKESDFADLSSATIRNYFASLEEEGFLTQQHSSGGRIPTAHAYRFYAQQHTDSTTIAPEHQRLCQELSANDSREITGYLQLAAEQLSCLTNGAAFLSAPRFDHDFIIGIKLLNIDAQRCLCVLITDFGVVQSELIYLESKLSAFAIKRIEEYFQWRLTAIHKPEHLEPQEEKLAQKIYNELMLRYLVGYSNFTDEEIYRTGFAKLISYPEFQDAAILASSLSLFENAHSMRLLLRECSSMQRLKIWIEEDLSSYTNLTPNCSVAAIPYYVNQQAVGAIGVLTPMRISYKEICGLLHAFSDSISTALTRNIYKFKIKYRQPHEGQNYLQKEERPSLSDSQLFLLEDQSSTL